MILPWREKARDPASLKTAREHLTAARENLTATREYLKAIRRALAAVRCSVAAVGCSVAALRLAGSWAFSLHGFNTISLNPDPNPGADVKNQRKKIMSL